MSQRFSTDVLIIGGGAAGLAASLNLAEKCRVTVLCKGGLESSSSHWAQGGVAAVVNPDDSIKSHAEDTITAGAGLCDENVVTKTVSKAPDMIRKLMDWGVQFDQTEDNFHLTQEGGHSFRRILHVADSTGRAINERLTERALDHPNIEVLYDRTAVDLINASKIGKYPNLCAGAYVLNSNTGHVEVFQSKYTVLATGGASKVYLYTTNPDGSTGDGIAMAWRAGCRVANMEFNQFHPTCLYHPLNKSFLISEVIRGEGGVLRLPTGERFMQRFDPRVELAPRDIVARAIDHEIKRLGIECVHLDISHRPKSFIEKQFPSIAERCKEHGIDITTDPIPVVPAAHYTCGGVLVDSNGRTDIAGLYAIGETSCTGLHGANRLASNSLLECLVYGMSAAEDIKQKIDGKALDIKIPKWDESQVTNSDEEVIIAHNWDELRRSMWDYVGIVRTDKRLQRARRRIELLKQEVNEYYTNYRVSSDLIELRNLIHVAELIVLSALSREESRGLHYNTDHLNTNAKAEDTVLFPSSTGTIDLLQPVATS
tara:strand:+ start:2014 stop:3636 length:1623 start_codon:yes stop_codon:yes gene_type:complete